MRDEEIGNHEILKADKVGTFLRSRKLQMRYANETNSLEMKMNTESYDYKINMNLSDIYIEEKSIKGQQKSIQKIGSFSNIRKVLLMNKVLKKNELELKRIPMTITINKHSSKHGVKFNSILFQSKLQIISIIPIQNIEKKNIKVSDGIVINDKRISLFSQFESFITKDLLFDDEFYYFLICFCEEKEFRNMIDWLDKIRNYLKMYPSKILD